jgi:hypothetical protein
VLLSRMSVVDCGDFTGPDVVLWGDAAEASNTTFVVTTTLVHHKVLLLLEPESVAGGCCREGIAIVMPDVGKA